MEPLRVCLCLLLALTYASGCGLMQHYRKATFDEGVYVSVRGTGYLRAFIELGRYARKGNDQNATVSLGPLIVQVENTCKPTLFQRKFFFVFSRKINKTYDHNPPQPSSKLVKIDYQLGKSGDFYSRSIFLLYPGMISYSLNRFLQELKCNNITVQDKWFYIVYKSSFPFGRAEIRLQGMSSYRRKKRSRCPPDDSNIEQLCNGKSAYSCPNMTFEEKNGISVRNVSMYIVTGEPIRGTNCSMNSARYTQYLGNHYYFMGNNSQSKRMLRTIPVMTKAIRISDHSDPCQKKYQMQFYVNTEHLDKSNLPCPTQPGVMLQKVEHMTIYVKTLNGNPDTDMSKAKDTFTKELDRKNMPYINGRHYIAQYRGHGPMFGRTMEIWVEKTEPRYVTVCQGGGGNHKTTTPSLAEPSTTTASKTTSDSLIVSYY